MATTVSMSTRRGRRIVSLALGGAIAAAAALGTLTAPTTAEAAAVRIQTTTDLNVRNCASTSCRVLGVLPAGSCVVAHGWAAGRTWVRISFRGVQGFVSARYVRRGCY